MIHTFIHDLSLTQLFFLISSHSSKPYIGITCIVMVFFMLLGLWWRRQWQPTPVLLPGKSHGRRSLVGYSPWGHEQSDTTELLHFHFSLSCIGEGNGNPLQYSCLENPRDSWALWAAVFGVAQSWIWLKQLSSGSSNCEWLGCSYFGIWSSDKCSFSGQSGY